MSIPNERRVYALAGFSVEVRPRGYFFKKTYADDDWHGPYSSPASVSLMIARQLGKELKRRDAPHELPT
jgi:hypothetical protein